jgi:hypothetical protein
MRILVAWYSRTGTTARVVEGARPILEGLGHEVAEARIVPRRDFPYPVWLALSFVPGARVPLAGRYPAPEAFDACLLVVPKWTFSCPPVNQYLARFRRRLPPAAVLLTYGGFDEARYLQALERQLWRAGVPLLGSTLLKRRRIEAGAFEADLRHFLVAAFPSSI